MSDLPDFAFVTKRDYHPNPFRRVVVLGESHVAEGTWVNVFGALLTEFQGPPRPEVLNAGIGANVISRRSPGYAASAKPSALERFRDDVIRPGPDLVIISYGLNDMRAGMPTEDFREDLAHLAGEIRRALDAVIVLTTTYNMSAYALYPPFDKGSPDASIVYNLVIRQVAQDHDALVADIWDAEGGAPWLIETDTVHANVLGQTLIGHRVFQTVASNCSGAASSLRVPEEMAREELARGHQTSLLRMLERLSALRREDGPAGE